MDMPTVFFASVTLRLYLGLYVDCSVVERGALHWCKASCRTAAGLSDVVLTSTTGKLATKHALHAQWRSQKCQLWYPFPFVLYPPLPYVFFPSFLLLSLLSFSVFSLSLLFSFPFFH